MRALPLALIPILLAAPVLAEDGAFDDDGAVEAATYDELAAAPPELPASASPEALHAALSPSQRATVDRDQRVVTFAHRIRKRGSTTELVGVSLGALPHPPEVVRRLLSDVAGLPDWIRLQPSYKTARVDGSRLTAGIGSASEPKAKRTMIYEIEPTAQGALWTVVDSGTPLEAGSTLEFVVVPHPSMPGASLVVHEQTGLVPQGRMLKYMTSDDKEGRNRWWKDCNRHARRLHWAMEAACSQPPGDERRRAYVGHFQREFGGKVPFWAGR